MTFDDRRLGPERDLSRDPPPPWWRQPPSRWMLVAALMLIAVWVGLCVGPDPQMFRSGR